MECGILGAAKLSRIVSVLLEEEAFLDDVGDGAVLESVPEIVAIPADVVVPMATALQEESMDHLMQQHSQDLLRGSSALYTLSELDRYPRAISSTGSNGPSEQRRWKRGPLQVDVTLQHS